MPFAPPKFDITYTRESKSKSVYILSSIPSFIEIIYSWPFDLCACILRLLELQDVDSLLNCAHRTSVLPIGILVVIHLRLSFYIYQGSFVQTRDEISLWSFWQEAHYPKPTSLLILSSASASTDRIFHNFLSLACGSYFRLISETTNECEFGEGIIASAGGEVARDGGWNIAAESEHLYGSGGVQVLGPVCGNNMRS